jgi:hypothetical protein
MRSCGSNREGEGEKGVKRDEGVERDEGVLIEVLSSKVSRDLTFSNFLDT